MTLTDTGVILFPSLTFCKKYIFDQNSGVLDQLQAGAVGAGQARAWVQQHTASRDRMFRLELQTIHRQQSVFTITERAPTRALSLVESTYLRFHI